MSRRKHSGFQWLVKEIIPELVYTDGHTNQLDKFVNLTTTCLDYILCFCLCFHLKPSWSGPLRPNLLINSRDKSTKSMSNFL